VVAVTFRSIEKSSLVQQVILTESKTHKTVPTMKSWEYAVWQSDHFDEIKIVTKG